MVANKALYARTAVNNHRKTARRSEGAAANAAAFE